MKTEALVGHMATKPRITHPVLGVPIDAISLKEAINRISQWGQARASRYVCVCNVHAVTTASQESAFMTVLASADMALPDGAPVAWMLIALGAAGQRRVSGPDLMLRYCEHACATGESIFLYGSTEETLALLQRNLLARWPQLKIAGAYAPPFRVLTTQEDDAAILRINESDAATVWVSLGCPKQEIWMAAHRGRVNATMIGVGAAFDFHAGTLKRAPVWMRDHGLEWLHRLANEPRRLWKRYAQTNTIFLAKALRQLLARNR